jgi:DNA-binding NarL/FixJ family response regulator
VERASSPRKRLAVVAPNDLNWAAVRQLLVAMPRLDVVADIKSRDQLDSFGVVQQPEVVVAAPVLSGEPTPLLLEAQSGWASARMIVLVDRFESARSIDLTRNPNASCLCWNDLTPEALEHCLLAALSAPLRMVSASIAEQQSEPAATPEYDEQFSQKGIAVLRGLGAGLTQQQVARHEGISLRTVQRVIAELQSQLNVRSLFALGRAVEQRGLLSGCLAPSRQRDAGESTSTKTRQRRQPE